MESLNVAIHNVTESLKSPKGNHVYKLLFPPPPHMGVSNENNNNKNPTFS